MILHDLNGDFMFSCLKNYIEDLILKAHVHNFKIATESFYIWVRFEKWVWLEYMQYQYSCSIQLDTLCV